MNRYEIEFKYADSMSGYQWRTQHCSLCADSPYQATKKCIELYGLGIDCDYEIISVKEMA